MERDVSTGSEPYIVVSSDTHAGLQCEEYRPYLESSLHEEFDRYVAERHAHRRIAEELNAEFIAEWEGDNEWGLQGAYDPEVRDPPVCVALGDVPVELLVQRGFQVRAILLALQTGVGVRRDDYVRLAPGADISLHCVPLLMGRCSLGQRHRFHCTLSQRKGPTATRGPEGTWTRPDPGQTATPA